MTNPNPSEPQNTDSMSEQASRHTLALNPLVALRGKDLVSSAGTLRLPVERREAARQLVARLARLARQSFGR